MKLKIAGFTLHRKMWDGADRLSFCELNMDTNGYTTLCPTEIEIEVPDGFNSTAAAVAALTKERVRLRNELAARIAEIDLQLSKLLALEFVLDEVLS